MPEAAFNLWHDRAPPDRTMRRRLAVCRCPAACEAGIDVTTGTGTMAGTSHFGRQFTATVSTATGPKAT